MGQAEAGAGEALQLQLLAQAIWGRWPLYTNPMKLTVSLDCCEDPGVLFNTDSYQ